VDKSSTTDVHPFGILFKEKPSITDVHLFGVGVQGKHQSSIERKNHPLHKFIHLASELEGKIKSSIEAFVSGKKSSITEVHPFRPVSNEKNHPSILGGVKGGNQCEREKTGVCVCVCVCVCCLRDRRVGTCPWRW
jgi:hypothetical protein